MMTDEIIPVTGKNIIQKLSALERVEKQGALMCVKAPCLRLIVCRNFAEFLVSRLKSSMILYETRSLITGSGRS